MTDISDLRNRFARLLDRLEQGCVVPFVGAGISQEASTDVDKAFKPKASSMQESLSKELAKISDHGNLIQSLISNHDLEVDGIYQKCKGNGPDCNRIGNHIEGKKHVSLDRLAEVHDWLHSESDTCEVLNIKNFAFLNPLEAHQYLAYLAREGLITEIISTNYDCCIEKAFERSFLPDVPENPNNNPLAVIRDLPEYREYGGRLKIADSLQRPILHLYKINGCADRYALCPDPSRIILTEKQLQNFRDDKWAQDLLADRARRRNLLFCGFGSEEPQIRHTALAISNEFHEDRTKSRPLDDIYKLPNAPFLSTYRQPSFAQLQIMVSHIRAHMKEQYQELGESAKINSWMGNIFSGKDARFLGAAADKLDADLFFKRLFQAAFGRLLARQTQKGSVFFHWISNLTSQPASWCSYLKQGLFPCEDNSAQTGTNLVDQSYFSTLPCLFEPSKNGILLLWRILWAIKYPDKKLRDDSLWYLPLREDPIFILTALLLLLGLAFKYNAQPCDYCLIPPNVKGDRFCLTIRDDSGAQPLTVYLIHRFARYRVLKSQLDQQSTETKSRIIRVISVPGENFHKRKERFTHELCPANREKPKALFVGSRYRIDAEDLISLAGTPENLSRCIRKAFSLSGKSERRVGLNPSD